MKNSVHLDNPKHPFTGGGGKSIKPSLAHMKGVCSDPGGEGNLQSANAQMKIKDGVSGPGIAGGKK